MRDKESDEYAYNENSSLNVTFEDGDKVRKNEMSVSGKEMMQINTNLQTGGNEDKICLSETDSKNLQNFQTNLNLIQEKIVELITNEKEAVVSEIHNLSKARVKLNEFKIAEKTKFNKEKEKWINTFLNDSTSKSNEILDLNIGGVCKISTTKGTLTKFPMSALALLFSGKYDLPKIESRIFIDRDGEPFVNMINYLRTGKYPIFKDRKDEVNFMDELKFWKIPISSPQYQLSDRLDQFDSEWCAPTLTLEENNTVIRKDSKQIFNLI